MPPTGRMSVQRSKALLRPKACLDCAEDCGLAKTDRPNNDGFGLSQLQVKLPERVNYSKLTCLYIQFNVCFVPVILKDKVMNLMLKSTLSVSLLALAAGTIIGCSNDNQPVSVSNVANSSSASTAGAALPRAAVAANAQFAAAPETAASLQERKEVAACSLENVVNMADNSRNPGDKPNSYQVSKGRSYKLIGFATNVEAGTVPKSIRLMLEGSQTYAINAMTGSERPDVEKFFKKPELAGAGYQVDAAFDDVAPGEYSVVVLESDASPTLCPTHQTITIK
jgi:hypothetical protein